MKKVFGLALVVGAIAALAGYMNRERIQEKIEEKRAEEPDLPASEELLREEEIAAPAVAEPF